MAILKSIGAVALASAVLSSPILADDWPQWRGPNRNGLSSETGLRQEWPKDGPKLLWQIDTAGSGYSTPAVVGDRLYLLGNRGLEDEFVEALSIRDGQTVWTTHLGIVGNPNQDPKFPAARSTPTVQGGFIFALSSDGDLACLQAATGQSVWKKQLRSEFGGKPGAWAYAESPLVDGNRLIVTPGGAQATLVALDRRTGNVLWKCTTLEADEAAYASAIVVTMGGVRQYVQLLSKGLVGVQASDGKLLWRYAKAVSRFGANIPTPLSNGELIYTGVAGTGGGAIRLMHADGQFQPQTVYFEAKYPTAVGGVVAVGNLLFGTTGQALLCVEFPTGRVLWEERAIGAGSICSADRRLYLHGENGEVALVEPSAQGYRERGRFTPPNPPRRINELEKAWAYPVVSNGRLLIRDHNRLWCYDVKAE